MIQTKEIPSRGRKRLVIQQLMGAVCGLLFCAAGSPPLKAQTYHCEYEYLSKPDKGRSDESRVEISGDVLKRIVKQLPPYRLSGRLVTSSEYRYKILVHNKVGIVATQLHSEISKDFGPLVGAKILTIRTSDGAMREGTVQVDGVYDLSKGHCRVNRE